MDRLRHGLVGLRTYRDRFVFRGRPISTRGESLDALRRDYRLRTGASTCPYLRSDSRHSLLLAGNRLLFWHSWSATVGLFLTAALLDRAVKSCEAGVGGNKSFPE